MIHTAADLNLTNGLPTGGQQLAVGEVVKVSDQIISVSLDVQQIEAQLAVLDYCPALADRVLVIGDGQQGYFLIGVLATSQPRPKLTVDSSGTTRLEVEQGDLQLVASNGKIKLAAATGMEATSAGPVELRSATAVRISVLDRLGKLLSYIGLTRDVTKLSNKSLQLSAHELNLEADQGKANLKKLDTEIGSAKITASRLSMNCETVMTSIGNAYQKVSGIWQLAAERTRMVVNGTSHHKAKRIYSKADDVKVKSDKIHLG